MTKSTFLLSGAMLLSVAACANTEQPSIAPSYSETNKTEGRFVDPVSLDSRADVQALASGKWFFSYPLINDSGKSTEIASCEQLKQAQAQGFKGEDFSMQGAIEALELICNTWQAMAKLEASHTSWINFTHSKEVAEELPAEFALAISNDTVERVAQSEHWSDVTTIKKVEPVNEDQAVYYDTDGSIQRLTLMAQGDYNGDGIEDAIFYMENGVDGGSYSSVNTYIVTRLQQGAPITLLAKW
ncbi:hypothetical protein W04_0279 [Pseudoalteromonas sp. SW0106-04]|uniref:hypothetical protein n=1 Tax=Pseudoalteromonas sp. SW0106-04 TaxID=1702169 RepID=UPI0006B4900E|nr:hypothetical protein [Pseudoalteromonas sp. SW0106-04]GAP73768.1 hypothetical protein W04_0279 [Pseudoalteromonas sp. SW0106-04]